MIIAMAVLGISLIVITAPIWILWAARRLSPKQKIEMPVRPKRRAF